MVAHVPQFRAVEYGQHEGMLAGFALLYQMPVFRALWFNPPLIVLDFLPVPKQVYMGAVE